MDMVTDADVMKGLECCGKYNGCLNCPFDDQRSNVNECVTKLSQAALNLINRRQSEYDALKAGYEIMKESSIKLKNQNSVARVDAVKSFWMWLRDYAVSQTLFTEYEEGRMVVEYGDDLLKKVITANDVKFGTWLINPDGYYPYCSECEEEPAGRKMTKFCPNCGLPMKQNGGKK